MPKLTETTNDKTKRSRKANAPIPVIVGGNGAAPPNRIVAAHEPLKDEPFIPPAPAEQPFVPTGGFVFTPPVIPQAQQVAPDAQPKQLKIALVGTAPSSRMLAPYGDTSWEIWACSPGNMNVIPRVNAWFEIHGNLLWPEHKHYGEPYLEWLKKQSFPVYMQDTSLIPNAVIFPKEEMVKEFGMDFFTSTFAWMMAFAITKGANEIALYGIDMASRDEYILQRPGFYFFKWAAEKRGIKVTAPNESDIMMHPGLYGYSDVLPFARKLHARRKEIKDRITQMKGERDRLSQNIVYLEGADEDIDYVLSIWSGVQDK